MIRLNHTHSFLNLQQNFSNKIFHSHFVLWQIPSKLSKIRSNSPTYSANYAKFAPIINPFILHYVSGTCLGREPSGIPVNYANSVQFTHIVRESRENLHHLLTYYTLCFRCLTSGRELPKIPAKFAQFTHISREFRAFCIKIHPYLVCFRSPTFDREPQKIGANQPDFTQFTHNSCELHEIQ